MKAFKSLPSNHQWIKNFFLLLFKFLKLAEKKIKFLRAVLWTTLFYYILIIVCIYTCLF